jgi:PKD repeat protein
MKNSKKYNLPNMKTYHFYLMVFAMISLIGCEPFVDDKIDIGGPPSPSFEIMSAGTPNDFVFKNTTQGGFLTKWDLGPNGSKEGNEVEVNFPFKGTYDIKMTTFNKGGSASTSQTLTVTEDDPNACFGNFKILTGCAEKVWKLAPEANAMHIGPSLNETWWGNGEADVTTRFCHFNDEYIFRSNGEFEYDNKGDFWADDNGSGVVWPADLGLEIGCNPASSWPDKYKAWDSGVYGFSATENSITIVGEGAWIGLYKVGTTDEVVVPQSSITYSIDEISENRMVIFADFGWGVWRFTLVSE